MGQGRYWGLCSVRWHGSSGCAARRPVGCCSSGSWVGLPRQRLRWPKPILTAGEQLLGSRVLGIRLFAAQVLAGYLTAALLNRLHPAPAAPVRSAQSTQTAPPRLDEVIAQAAVQYLKLCGFVLYFRMLAAGCGQFLPAAWAPFPAMLLEVCSGCDYAARTGLWASSLCCAALSVQGASVLLQVRTLCPGEVSFRPLLAGRLLHLPLSLALFCLTWPEQAVETFGNLCERVIPMQRVPPDCALLAFAVCCMAACELNKGLLQREKWRNKRTFPRRSAL